MAGFRLDLAKANLSFVISVFSVELIDDSLYFPATPPGAGGRAGPGKAFLPDPGSIYT